jgi:hypothetical protein
LTAHNHPTTQRRAGVTPAPTTTDRGEPLLLLRQTTTRLASIGSSASVADYCFNQQHTHSRDLKSEEEFSIAVVTEEHR